MQRITVVGIGADGWDGLAMESRRLVREAEVVMGDKRHLDSVPWSWWQARVEWPWPVEEALPGLLEEHDGKRIVVLAAGDPLVAGIATPLVNLVGADDVDVIPTVSSESLARARMRWSFDETSLVSLHGRDVRRLLPHLAPGRKLIVLSSDGGTPASVAALLVTQGYGETAMTVLSDLGGLAESRTEATAAAWRDRVSAEVNVICLECVADGSRRSAMSSVPGLPEAAFGSEIAPIGRDARAAALSRLAPAGGDLLWALGAGAAAVAIEWLRSEPLAAAVVVVGADEAVAVKESAADLGVPELRIVEGAAPAALDGLDAPDAVFVGGGAADAPILDAVRSAVRPGGRLVVQAASLDEEAALLELFRAHDGELVRIGVEEVLPAESLAWTPRRAVVQWSLVR